MARRIPDIWLQDDEESGTAVCGCQLVNDERGVQLYMCKKHRRDVAAAYELKQLRKKA